MNLEQLAFVNQQLAAMLRHGIPLESALGQLCQSMSRGDLREELERLRADLASGTPFDQAVAVRALPPFYVQMLRVGAKSNDLPGVLTLVADYYQRAHLIAVRLKGLMVYPVIVLVGALALSAWLAFFLQGALRSFQIDVFGHGETMLPGVIAVVWMPPFVIVAVTVLILVTVSGYRRRQWLRWHLPALHDANLAQAAAAMGALLRSGCPLREVVALLRQLEADSPAAAELARWEERLQAGETQLDRIAGGGRAFPPLFVSLLTNTRDDLAAAAQQAADLYERRAAHRAEMLLQAALPAAIVALGILIATQLFTITFSLTRIVNQLGTMG